MKEISFTTTEDSPRELVALVSESIYDLQLFGELFMNRFNLIDSYIVFESSKTMFVRAVGDPITFNQSFKIGSVLLYLPDGGATMFTSIDTAVNSGKYAMPSK